jgi:hypothetical protein
VRFREGRFASFVRLFSVFDLYIRVHIFLKVEVVCFLYDKSASVWRYAY